VAGAEGVPSSDRRTFIRGRRTGRAPDRTRECYTWVMKKVLTGGVFDILHFGHVHFLKEAKKLGNYLVVAIESDANVARLKGPSRPIHSQTQRKEVLEALEFVDEVIVLKDNMTDKDYDDLVARVQPLIIAVTAGDPILAKKQTQAASIGATLIEIPKIDVASTTKIAKLLDLE